MSRIVELVQATPNTVEAIRKAHAIKKDLTPDGSVHYSFPSSGGGSGRYNGMWKVELDGKVFKTPIHPAGNLVLSDTFMIHNIQTVLQTDPTIFPDTLWNTWPNGVWIYAVVTTESVRLVPDADPPYEPYNASTLPYEYYNTDRALLAHYSAKTGMTQLQYGPIRVNRFWLTEGTEE